MDDVNLGPEDGRRWRRSVSRLRIQRNCRISLLQLVGTALPLVLQILTQQQNCGARETAEGQSKLQNDITPSDDQIPTHCDILLTESTSLAAKCMCKDLDILAAKPINSNEELRVSQLICDGANFIELISDLNMPNSKPTSIDFLSLSANMTSENSESHLGSSTKRLQVDHLSLQLQVNVASNSTVGHQIEEQLSEVFKFIHGTRVQFLSLVIELGTCDISVDETNTFGLTRLMSHLINLSRLDLTLTSDEKCRFRLKLDSDTFAKQHKMKWLNLASGGGLEIVGGKLESNSPFAQIIGRLEYLSLQGNQLRKFRIFDLLSSGSKIAAKTRTLASNLSSLNLARNDLKSLELDFFANEANEPGKDKARSLPSLTQLDLSHNKLTGLTLNDCQLLLLTMPNLSQLYLQDNQIVQLNLNSLLFYPLNPMPKLISKPRVVRYKNSTNSTATRLNTNLSTATQISRLELIDLSRNELLKITGITWDKLKVLTKIKSINLAHNNLRRPINLIDRGLINRIVFRENLEMSEESNDQFELTVPSTSNQLSLCDFLSSSPDDADLLNEVILTNNLMIGLKSIDFNSRQCRQVQVLKLARNQIGSIENNSFISLRNLESIDLSSNELTNLTSGSLFVSNKKLRSLSLSKNKLRLVASDLLSNLIDLEELFLNDNLLGELPKDFLRFNSKIIALDLSNNKLNFLSDRLLSHLTQLKILNINGNKLRSFDHRIFEFGSSALMTMQPYGGQQDRKKEKSGRHEKVQKSKAKNLQLPADEMLEKPTKGRARQLKTTTTTKRSHLARRQVGELGTQPSITGDNLLVLASNQIDSYTQVNCSKFMQNLNIIWLNDNRITRVTSETFECSSQVQRLYLQANLINSIDSHSFDRLSQLDYLNLARNQLNQLPARLLAPCTNLRHLNVSHNLLYQFKFSQLFEKLESLNVEILDLSYNQNLKLDLNDLLKFLRKNQHSLKSMHLNSINAITLDQSNPTNRLIQLDGEGMRLESVNLFGVNVIPEALFSSLTSDSIKIEKLELNSLNRASERKFLIEKLTRGGLSNLKLSSAIKFMEIVENVPDDTVLQLSHLDFVSNHENPLEVWPFSVKSAPKLSDLIHLKLAGHLLRHMIKLSGPSEFTLSAYTFIKLETLNLSSNALIGLIDHPTQRVTRLKSLMPNLRHFDLSNNRLTWIPYEFFDGLDQLLSLKLNGNQLETLSLISLRKNLPSSFSLDLSINPHLKASMSTNRSSAGFLIDSYLNLDTEGLILSTIEISSSFKIKCQLVEEFLFATGNSHMMSDILDGDIIKQYEPSIDMDLSVDGDLTSATGSVPVKCSQFLPETDLLKLGSTGLGLSSVLEIAKNYRNNRFLALDIGYNGISSFGSKESVMEENNNIILLDLNHNKLQRFGSLCHNLKMLMTLNVSNNQLSEIPYDISSCKHLTHLDLSHNQISTLVLSQKSTSTSLLVLDLSNNRLDHLNGGNLSHTFRSLKYLDLRNNLIKSDATLLIPHVKHILVDSSVILQRFTPRYQIIPSDDSLVIESHEKYPLNIKSSLSPDSSDGRIVSTFPENNRHLLRFCTLAANEEVTHICLKDDCLAFENDPEVKSCLTSLTTQASNRSANLNKIHLSSDPSQLIGRGDGIIRRQEENKLSDKDDPVLSFIDYIKSSWLKFKEIKMMEQFARVLNLNEAEDSVWLEFGTNKGYKIYTSHLIKFAILSGATCIVCLLIAMFVLLTYLTHSRGSSSAINKSSLDRDAKLTGDCCELAHCSDHSSNSSRDSSRNTTNSDTGQQTTTSLMATNGISYNNTSTNCSSGSSQSKSTSKSNTRSSSSGSRDEIETIIERQQQQQQHQQQQQVAPALQLDVNALAMLHQQNQQLMQQIHCSTPSNSSLAPSSVETAETLQAVDSIQTNTSTLCQHQADQLTPTNLSLDQQFVLDTCESSHYGQCKQTGQRQLPIATVMRMVKSNSAHFPGNSNGRPNDSDLQGQNYGTLNARNFNMNYGTLRAKRPMVSNNYALYSTTTLRDNHSRQPLNSSSEFPEFPPPPIIDVDLNLNSNSNSLSRRQTQQPHHSLQQQLPEDQVDPTTLSLLSINTALSGSNIQHLITPTNPSSGHDNHQSQPQTSTSTEHHQHYDGQNLCHYHRLTSGNSNNNYIVAPVVSDLIKTHHQIHHLSSGVILEQEEEQYQNQAD